MLVWAVIPNGIGSTNRQKKYVECIQDLVFDALVAIASRPSQFEGCWDQ